MPILKFRNKEAEKIEEIARERAIARQEAALRLKSRSGIMPPPGADLLGTWSVTEESLIAQNKSIPTSIEFENFHFETLSPGGHVLGRTTGQGKNIFQGRRRKGRVAKGVTSFKLEGYIISPGYVRFIQKPGPLYVNILTGPHICEAKWEGYEMTGYMYCDFTGGTMNFRALKVE